MRAQAGSDTAAEHHAASGALSMPLSRGGSNQESVENLLSARTDGVGVSPLEPQLERNNTRMLIARRWTVTLLVMACCAGCGARAGDTASPGPTADMPVVPTTPGPPAAGVPPVSDKARAAGFVDVRSVAPDAVITLRYATPNNFVGVPLYPADARCLVHESMGSSLAAAA